MELGIVFQDFQLLTDRTVYDNLEFVLRATGWKSKGERLEEYYPNALISTYQGVSGYIYRAETISEAGFAVPIPDAAASSVPVDVAGSEFISDAYEAILQAERKGLLSVVRYEELSERAKEWNEKTIREEYENASEHPEYRHFLKGNFPGILKD